MMMAAACAGPATEEATQADMAISPQQAQQQVQQADHEWAAAVIARDFTRLEQVYEDRLIYSHSSGLIETKSDYLGKLQAGTTRYDAIDYEALEVRAYGDAAVAHSRVVMRGENADGPFNNRLIMMHVWVNEGGEWRLVGHQTTLVEAVK